MTPAMAKLSTKRPSTQEKEKSADAFVEGKAKKEEPKRLTIDIPREHHRKLMAKCWAEGTKIAHVSRMDRTFQRLIKK